MCKVSISMLDNKVALVTGGAKGIGRAVALELARNGAKVAINYNTSEKAAKELVKEIEDIGGNAMIVKADISKNEEVSKMMKNIVNKFGKIDILINNAGVIEQVKFDSMTEQIMNKMIDTNLKGTAYCIKEVLPYMKKQGNGKIVNISSIAGIAGSMVNAMYGAAKAGVINMTKTLSRELAEYKINVNSVAPGVTKTDMISEIDEEIIDKYSKETPMKRIAEPEDVAKAVLFFASSQSYFITGQNLIVDGGRL